MGGAQGDYSQQSAEELELGVLLEVLEGGGGGEDDEPLPDYMIHDGWGSLEEEIQSTSRQSQSTFLGSVETAPQQESATNHPPAPQHRQTSRNPPSQAPRLLLL
ncbi:MAG: hypothetical protein WDW38_007162 [Sanguina aurantia]